VNKRCAILELAISHATPHIGTFRQLNYVWFRHTRGGVQIRLTPLNGWLKVI